MRHSDNTGAEQGLAKLVGWWIGVSVRRPRLMLAALCLMLLLAGLAAGQLKIDTDSSRMLSERLSFQSNTRAIAETFPATKRTILVVVRSRHVDAADAVVATLADTLRRDGEGIFRVFAPSADRFMATHGLLFSETGILDRRLTHLSQSANLLAELRENQTAGGFMTALKRASSLAVQADMDPSLLDGFFAEAAAVFEAEQRGGGHPFNWQGVLTEERTGMVLRTIAIEPELDFSRLNPAKPALETARRAIAGLDPGLTGLVETGITGDPALRAEELEAVTAQLATSVILSVILVAAVLFWALRRPARVALALATLGVTLVLTVGFAAVAVGTLNLISIAFVVLMVGLGIDFAIHTLCHLGEAGGAEEETGERLKRLAEEIGPALVLSAATTALAFLAFAATDFVGMAQLGLIGAGGVIIAFLVSVTLVPAMVALSPGIMSGKPALALPRLPHPAGRGALLAVVLMGAAAVWFAPQAHFDADPMNLRNPDAPSVLAYDWLTADPDRAPQRLGYIAGNAEEAASAAARLAGVPEVRSTLWLESLVPDDQDRKLSLIDLAWPSLDFIVNGTPLELASLGQEPVQDHLRRLGSPAADRLAHAIDVWQANAGSQKQVSEPLFRFFPQLLARVEAQLDVGGFGSDGLPGALVDRYRSKDGRYLVEILPTGNIGDPETRAQFVAAVNQVLPAAAGPPAQIHGAATTVAEAMVQAVLLALGGTLILALIALRRVSLVAAILVPLAFAGAVTLAGSALIEVPFNFANIIVLPLMIGIGVDSGIHLALRAAARKGSVFDSSTPRAVVASALTTIAAFGTLSLSDHAGTASMGILLALAMTASVIMIFAITPVLVRLFTGR